MNKLLESTCSLVGDSFFNKFPALVHLYVTSSLDAQLALLTRVSLKTQNVSQRAPPGIYAVSICGGPPKKNSEFYLKF